MNFPAFLSLPLSRLLCAFLIWIVAVSGQLSFAQSLIDVWDSSDPNNFVLVGTIQTIDSPQTGQQHYAYFSA